MSEEKTKAELLKEKLFRKSEHSCVRMGEEEVKQADSFCDGYMDFLNSAKTEREATSTALEMAKASGFTEFDKNVRYEAGSKVYVNNRGKAVILAVIGCRDIKEGVKIAAAHIDSPRLDIKPNPLYEDTDMAFLKTHYYGGIKKYQWPTVPLSLHGVIVKKDGSEVTVNIGEDEGDPKFVVTDLLIHLAGAQMKETLADGVKGENLNILIGSRPFENTDEAEAVKLNIMNILYEKYGITEDDFLSAELEAVPAY